MNEIAQRQYEASEDNPLVKSLQAVVDEVNGTSHGMVVWYGANHNPLKPNVMPGVGYWLSTNDRLGTEKQWFLGMNAKVSHSNVMGVVFESIYFHNLPF